MSLMDEFLAQDMYDEIPEGIPALDPEDDDEDDEDEQEFGAQGSDVQVVYLSNENSGGGGTSTLSSIRVTQTFAPKGFDTDTSVGFFLLPSDDLPGPEDPKHCTVVYLGHIGGDGASTLGDQKQMLMDLGNEAAKAFPPVTASVTGVEPLGDEGAVVWMLDEDLLVQLNALLLRHDSPLRPLYDEGTFTKYDPYMPHVTIGYGPKPNMGESIVAAGGWCAPSEVLYSMAGELNAKEIEAAKAVTQITFDRLALWFGEEHIEFPLSGQEG